MRFRVNIELIIFFLPLENQIIVESTRDKPFLNAMVENNISSIEFGETE